MGIRFICPNGHKLNVKEFQAGRLGICPFCGARIQIPMHSTRPASKSTGRQDAAQSATQTLDQDDLESAQGSDSSPEIFPGEPPSRPGDERHVPMAGGGKMLGPSTSAGTYSGGGPVVAPPSLSGGGRDAAAIGPSAPAAAGVNLRSSPVRLPSPVPSPTPAQPAPAAMPAAPVMPMPAPASPGPVVTAAPGLPAAGPAASQPAAPPAAPEGADPIAEAPEMIWYVRPPSGGQFGPAAGDLMRTWLSEGRVSADSLVWREGWRDWQEAGPVFPKLRNSQIADFLETTPLPAVALPPATHAHRPKVRRAADRKQIATLVVLSALIMVLISVLLWIVFHQ